MTAPQKMKTTPGALVAYDVPEYSRDTLAWDATVAAPLGAPVKLVNNQLTPALAADAAAVVGVLFSARAVGDREAVIEARHAVLRETGIAWPSGAVDAQKTAIKTTLAARGIVVRPVV